MAGNAPRSRSRLFIENFLIYGVGGALSKVVPFVMTPILARLYPATDYMGLNDSVSILVSFAAQVAILGVYDAMYRYFFEKESEEYRRRVTSSSLAILLVSGAVIAALLLVFRGSFASLIFAERQYESLIVIGAVTTYMTAINSVIAAPTRMRNLRLRYLGTNMACTVISYAIAIPLLVNKHYAVAMPLAAMFSMILSSGIFAFYNRKDFSVSDVKSDFAKQLLRLGVPCMPSFLFYWVMSSAQRILITNMIGLGATGVYSVGAKMAAVSQLIYAAFSAGWQYFAFSTMKDSDHVKLISKVFDYLGGITFFCACVMAAVARPVFGLLFEPRYAEGAWVMPALFLAPLIQMLYQSIATQFMVIKKTGRGLVCLGPGSIVAIGLDFLLIPRIGIRGAAVAALAGFTVALVIMAVLLLRRGLIHVSVRMGISAVAAYAAVFMFTLQLSPALYLSVAGCGAVLIGCLYFKDFIITCRQCAAAFLATRGNA